MPAKLYNVSMLPILAWQIETLKQFADHIEVKCDQDIEEIKDAFDELPLEPAEGDDADELRRLADQYGDDHFTIDALFRQQLRRAMVVTIHSFLEQFLTEACRQAPRERSLKLKADDLRGNGVVRSKNYLKSAKNSPN